MDRTGAHANARSSGSPKGEACDESHRNRTGTAGSRLVERPEPSITQPDDIKLRVIRVGICGTDREEVSGGRAQAPDGQKELVIGHEMFGQVASVGSSVTRVKTDDFAVFTVRRGCDECLSCRVGTVGHVPDR